MAESCRPASLPRGRGPPGAVLPAASRFVPSAQRPVTGATARPGPLDPSIARPRVRAAHLTHLLPQVLSLPQPSGVGEAKPPEHPRRQMARSGGDLAHQPERPSPAEQGGRRGPSRLEDSQRRGVGGTRPPDRLPLIRLRADPPSRRSSPRGRWVIAGGDRTGPVRPTGPGAGARAGVSLWGHWDYFRGCLEQEVTVRPKQEEEETRRRQLLEFTK